MKQAVWMLLGLRLAAQPSCMLEGVTTDAVTGKPLAGVKVFAHPVGTGSAPAYLRRSNAQGRYCFEGLVPGMYHVMAQRVGYLDQLYGARPGGDEALELAVAGNAPVPPANIKLAPRPVLTGTVLHADGQPSAETEVTVWQKVHTRQGPDQNTVESRQTDDRGVFRFTNLAPGTYYLSAEPESNEFERFSIEFLNGQGQRAHDEEAVTFSSGALSFSDARPIILSAGQELTGIVIALRKAPLRHISGRVSGAPENATVYLDSQSEFSRGTMIPVKPDGSFERSDVLAGKYTVVLQGETGNRALTEQEVDLTNGDAEGLVLEPRETFAVPLALRTEGDGPAVRPGQFWIMLTSLPRDQSTMARVAADGHMEFAQVLPGTYRVQAMTQGQPYFLKSVRLNDAVQSGAAVELRKAPDGPMELLFSSKVAAIEGRVSGEATGAVAILLVERGADDEDPAERAVSDQNGRFHMDGIKPGRYRLFAIEDFDDGSWGDPELAAALRSAEVELGESETRQVTVPLVTSKEWNAAVKRFGQ